MVLLRRDKVKRLLMIPLLLILSISTAVAEITIDPPPDKVEVGEDIDLFVKGIDYTELPNAKVIYFPRDIRVRPSLSWGLEPFITVRAKKAGEYLLAVAATLDDKLEYTEVIIVVGGDDTDPQPDPDPDPDPDPKPDEIAVVIVVESDDRTPEQGIVANQLQQYCNDQGIWYRTADPDQKDGTTNKPPDWLRTINEAIRAKSLPVLVVCALLDGKVSSVVSVEPLPGSGQEAIDFVKKYQGE
jgi:hypothetical protein